MTNEEQKLREFVSKYVSDDNEPTFLSDLTALISENYVDKDINDRLVRRADELTTQVNELYEVTTKLIHLHGCEQEGIGSGQPSPIEWINAVNAVEAVLFSIKLDKTSEQ